MAKTTDRGLNRRKMMLVTGGAVAGAGALIAAPLRQEIQDGVRGVLVGSGSGRGLLSLASASYEEWESVVGTSFSLGGRTNVQLVGVRALPSFGTKPRGVRSQGFAAFFDPPRGQSVAPDMIYTATHPVYGTTQLYLAATSDLRTPGRMLAVFN